MYQKPRIIFNPAAGKGHAAKCLPQIQALLQEYNFEYDLYLTERPGHALELSRQAAKDGCSLVIAAGGDGTVNEVINGLMQARANGDGHTALGVLPIGRGNDFAYGAGIPHELAAACLTLAGGLHCKIDIGHVTGGDYPQGRYFGNGIGLGFDTVVGFEAAKIKIVKGALSYLVAVFKTIFLYARAPIYEVIYDDTTLQQPFLMVSLMNGKRMGGAFMMAPQGNPGDGHFDLCLVGHVSQPGILTLVPKFISGTQGDHPAVKTPQAKRIRIRAVEGTIPAHADGETLCIAGQELTIMLHPAALDVITLNGRCQN